MALMFVKPTSTCNCGGQFYWHGCPHGGFWQCQKCGEQVLDSELDTDLVDLSDKEINTVILALRSLQDYLGIDDHALAKVRYTQLSAKYADILDGMPILGIHEFDELIENKINVA